MTLSILPLAVHVAVVVLVEPPAHQVGQEHHHHHTRQDAAHNDGDEVIGLSNGAVRGGLKSKKVSHESKNIFVNAFKQCFCSKCDIDILTIIQMIPDTHQEQYHLL